MSKCVSSIHLNYAYKHVLQLHHPIYINSSKPNGITYRRERRTRRYQNIAYEIEFSYLNGLLLKSSGLQLDCKLIKCHSLV